MFTNLNIQIVLYLSKLNFRGFRTIHSNMFPIYIIKHHKVTSPSNYRNSLTPRPFNLNHQIPFPLTLKHQIKHKNIHTQISHPNNTFYIYSLSSILITKKIKYYNFNFKNQILIKFIIFLFNRAIRHEQYLVVNKPLHPNNVSSIYITIRSILDVTTEN